MPGESGSIHQSLRVSRPSHRVVAGDVATDFPVQVHPQTAIAEVVPGTAMQVARDRVGIGHDEDQLPSQLPQTVSDVWALCLRYRRLVLGVGIACAALVLLKALRITPLYESTASLELYSPPKPVNYQDNGSDESAQFFDISRVNTQRERILSTPVLERALSTSDFANGPAYRQSDDAVGVLRSRLAVNVNKDNYVFEIAFQDEDKLRAQRGLKAVLDAFFAEQDDRAGTHANSSLAFLQKQVVNARRAADADREEEEAFKREHNILSTDPEENLHSRTLRELTTKRSDLAQRRLNCDSLVREVEEAMALNDPAKRREALLRIDLIGANQLVQKQQEQLFQAQADAEKLAPRFGPKHPRMQEAQLEISARTKELDMAIDISRQDILTTAQQLGQEQISLDKLISTESAQLDAYRADLNRLQALTESTKAASDLLDDLMRRAREQDVVAHLNAKQVIVNNPPGMAVGPINIHFLRSAVLALMLGLVSGVGSALVAELLERNIHGAARARELTGLPLLGAIPIVPNFRALAGGDPERDPAIASAFRALRENLILTGGRLATGRCLMVTSPNPEEGKSSISARLAVSFAAAGARVLLDDVDMRRPSQPSQMGVSAKIGLTALLARAEAITPMTTPYKNLDFIAVGESPSNPAELLYSPHMGDWLAQARMHYDIILCDSSPLFVTDPLILGEQCDGIILVVRDRCTGKRAIREALLSLQPLRDRVLGFVLNGAREDADRHRYNYYYASRYATGQPKSLPPAAVA